MIVCVPLFKLREREGGGCYFYFPDFFETTLWEQSGPLPPRQTETQKFAAAAAPNATDPVDVAEDSNLKTDNVAAKVNARELQPAASSVVPHVAASAPEDNSTDKMEVNGHTADTEPVIDYIDFEEQAQVQAEADCAEYDALDYVPFYLHLLNIKRKKNGQEVQ